MLVVGDREAEAARGVSVRMRRKRRTQGDGRWMQFGRSIQEADAERAWDPRRRPSARTMAHREGQGPNERARSGHGKIRVIDEDGQQLGVMPPRPRCDIAARQRAGPGRGLAERHARPCAGSWTTGKYKYQINKKAHRRRSARQHQIQVKEVKFRPQTDGARSTSSRAAHRRFLIEGDKVKATVMFRGREMAHPRRWQAQILERLREELAETALVEVEPRQEGPFHDMILARRSGRAAPEAASRKGEPMPKMKTHRGAAKRFKNTATGKIKRVAGLQEPHPDQEGQQAETAPGSVRAHQQGRRTIASAG